MFRPKKSLGQNFLVDKNIINKIVSLAKIKKKNIVEIGPGTGNLTKEIIKQEPSSLILIEKDKFLSKDLNNNFKNKKTKVFNKDILNFNLEKIIKKNSIIFGNLPYNISSQILIKIIKFKDWLPKYDKLILMFQKEVADKILANHNTSSYGRISIITKYRLRIVDHFDVSMNCFFPKPKVNSTVLVFEPKKENFFKIKDLNKLEKITHIFFSGKRKMINKAFKKVFINHVEAANKLNIDLTTRPSQISEEEYYKITNLFEKL